LLELGEVRKGSSFCVGDRGLALELGIAKGKQSEGRYLAGIVRGVGVLSKRVEKCGVGRVFRG
jgi:hypothetical protein